MSEAEAITEQFKRRVCEQVSLAEKGVGKYQVLTPFMFEDGDHFVIHLKYRNMSNGWYLSDEGHTFMHLSYFLDERELFRGTRKKIMDDAQRMFEVSEKDGELYKDIENGRFGDALYDFLQCLLKMSDVTFLERERVRSTFYEDFRASVQEISKRKNVPLVFDTFAESDRERAYPIDGIIRTKEPVFLFAIKNDNRCQTATICIYEFERRKMPFHPVGVFENQADIQSTVLARFSAVCDKQIPSLGDITRLEKFLVDYRLV